MIVVGIDPGLTGGFAVLQDNGVFLEPMPLDLGPVFQKIAALRPDMVFLEKAQSMPKQGIASAFNYGRHFGELLGYIAAYKLPHTLVTPQTWGKVMHAGTKGTDTKKRSVEAARRLFPKADLVPEGKRVPHLGIVEALLIAGYGWRLLASAPQK